MTNPTPLRPATIRPEPQTVSILEDALAEARAGRLRGVAVCGILQGGEVYYSYATEDNMLLIAQLARMQHMVLTNSYDTGHPINAENP